MENNELSTFVFENQEFKALLDEDGNPWFVAYQVGAMLGLTNSRQIVADFDDDEKLVYTIDTPAQKRSVTMVSEPGLFKMIFKSRKHAAKRFQKWVTSEVLPSLRKNGTYSLKSLSKLEILEMALESEKKLVALENRVEEDKPKIEYFNTFLDSQDAVPIGVVAEQLAKEGFAIGQNRLYEFLYDRKVLKYDRLGNSEGKFHKMPYQRYAHWLNIVDQQAGRHSDGSLRIKQTPLVNPKGKAGILALVKKYYEK